MIQEVSIATTPSRLLALPQVLEFVPVSRSTFWQGVKEGKYPPPMRISARRVAWLESDIIALVETFRLARSERRDA